MRSLLLSIAILSSGCAGVMIEPGHRGLLFNPRDGGTKQEPLTPGYYSLPSCFLRSACSRVDDYDVTYSTRKEEIQTTSSEGLVMELRVAVIFRPIVQELYQLHTEIGPSYYDEVIGPEFRSAARGVFARHSYLDLQKQNEKLEDEVETETRRRCHGKHVEIASITLESITYAPAINQAVQAKLVGEQEAIRKKAAAESEALREKLALEHDAEKERLKAETARKAKEDERKMAEEQAKVDAVRADARVTAAKADVTVAKAEAEATTIRAKAKAEELRADTQGITPLVVQMHAYDALGNLGGKGTTILIGDFSHLPGFLFPGFVQGGYGGGAPSPSPSPGARPAVADAPAASAEPASASAKSAIPVSTSSAPYAPPSKRGVLPAVVNRPEPVDGAPRSGRPIDN
jgi:regulator of protease activity HflC (stomatin/prohibitin superfamily)